MLDKKIGIMNDEEKCYWTLLYIYNAKGMILEEKMFQDPEYDGENCPELDILEFRKKSIEKLLHNNLKERFLEQSRANGFPGIVIDSEYNVWFFKRDKSLVSYFYKLKGGIPVRIVPEDDSGCLNQNGCITVKDENIGYV
jgi:hypothetical protein